MPVICFFQSSFVGGMTFQTGLSGAPMIFCSSGLTVSGAGSERAGTSRAAGRGAWANAGRVERAIPNAQIGTLMACSPSISIRARYSACRSTWKRRTTSSNLRGNRARRSGAAHSHRNRITPVRGQCPEWPESGLRDRGRPQWRGHQGALESGPATGTGFRRTLRIVVMMGRIPRTLGAVRHCFALPSPAKFIDPKRRKTTLIATHSQSYLRARHKDGEAGGRTMRWWIKALIYSVIFSMIWVGLVAAVGYFHTDVLLAGQLTPAQDQAISEKYGNIAGFGMVMVWVICFLTPAIRMMLRKELKG